MDELEKKISAHGFPSQILDGLHKRQQYVDSLKKNKRISDKSIDEITFPSDLLLMDPMYKALNDPNVSGTVDSQADIMIQKSPAPQERAVETTPEQKMDAFKLKLYMEDLRRNQNLA